MFLSAKAQIFQQLRLLIPLLSFDSDNTRVQATLFLPPPVNRAVEDIRRRWDPRMAQVVAAHVTLVHQVDDPSAFLQQLRSIATVTAPVQFTLTHAARWESPAGGIYVAVEDSSDAIAALRRSLLVTDPPGITYTPHVTLVHPRTTLPDRARSAWSALRDVRVNQHVTVEDVALMQNGAQGWELVDRIRLMG